MEHTVYQSSYDLARLINTAQYTTERLLMVGRRGGWRGSTSDINKDLRLEPTAWLQQQL